MSIIKNKIQRDIWTNLRRDVTKLLPVLPLHAKVRNKGVQSLNKEWTGELNQINEGVMESENQSQLVRRRKGKGSDVKEMIEVMTEL